MRVTTPHQPVAKTPKVYTAPDATLEFSVHMTKWCNCKLCPLHKDRSQVVFYRGQLPCDVLFVGEGPGYSEDRDGYPFVGPAGQLLDELIEQSIAPQNDPYAGDGLKLGFTNILACIPVDHHVEWSDELHREVEYSTPTIRPPAKAEAKACQPRLVEIIQLANPKLVVALGQETKKYLHSLVVGPNVCTTTHSRNADWLALPHPAAFLRQENEDPNGVALAKKRFILNLRSAVEAL